MCVSKRAKIAILSQYTRGFESFRHARDEFSTNCASQHPKNGGALHGLPGEAKDLSPMMTTIPIIVQILTAGVARALVAGATLLGIGYTKARDKPMPQEWAKRDGVQLLHSEPRAVRMYGSPWMLYRQDSDFIGSPEKIQLATFSMGGRGAPAYYLDVQTWWLRDFGNNPACRLASGRGEGKLQSMGQVIPQRADCQGSTRSTLA